MSIPSDRHLRALIIHHSARLSVDRAKKNMKSKEDFLAGHVAGQLIDGSWLGDLRQAKKEIDQWILALRSAKEPNPYKDLTDDQIAKEIIRELAERKGVVVKV